MQYSSFATPLPPPLGHSNIFFLFCRKPLSFSILTCFLFTQRFDDTTLSFQKLVEFKHSFPSSYDFLYFISYKAGTMYTYFKSIVFWLCRNILFWKGSNVFNFVIAAIALARMIKYKGSTSVDSPVKMLMAWICSSKILSLFHIRI